MSQTFDDIDWTSATIPQVLQRANRLFGDLDGLVDDPAAHPAAGGGPVVRWSFSELIEQVEQAGAALVATGVQPGSRVAIWAPNIWEWAVAALATHLAGCTLVPINTRFKGAEARYLLESAEARLLFCVTDFLDTNYVEAIRSAEGGVPESVEEIIVLRGAPAPDTTSFSDFVARADEPSREQCRHRAEAVDPDDIANILFTSGTTGAPKGAMLTHGATVRAHRTWCEVIGLQAEDRYLIINPFFHNFGLNAGILACLMQGAVIIPHPVFDVESVMRRIPVDRITMLPGPPAIYQTILNHPDLADFEMSSLRLAVTGAAPIAPSMIVEMKERLGFENIVTGYGLTECTGVATMCRADDDPERIATTSGRAIDGVEVRVVDGENTEVSRGEAGEIVIRGFGVMPGYLNNPEATAEAIDADGWLHTGDIGTMDDDGYIDITDRLKDMFIVGGFNAYPAEIEATLVQHPDLAQVAVIGVPDERMGEVGHAFVVAAAGCQPDPDAIIAWARERLANYKAPRAVHVLDALPLNASGKVQKFVLRESI